MILRFLRLNCSAMCALSQLSVLCKHVTNKHTKHGATNGHHVVFGGAGEKTSHQAAGWDLSTSMAFQIPSGERRLISTGIAVDVPRGCYGRIASRSSMAAQGLDVAGGVVDADYRGEVKVILLKPSPSRLGTESHSSSFRRSRSLQWWCLQSCLGQSEVVTGLAVQVQQCGVREAAQDKEKKVFYQRGAYVKVVILGTKVRATTVEASPREDGGSDMSLSKSFLRQPPCRWVLRVTKALGNCPTTSCGAPFTGMLPTMRRTPSFSSQENARSSSCLKRSKNSK